MSNPEVKLFLPEQGNDPPKPIKWPFKRKEGILNCLLMPTNSYVVLFRDDPTQDKLIINNPQPGIVNLEISVLDAKELVDKLSSEEFYEANGWNLPISQITIAPPTGADATFRTRHPYEKGTTFDLTPENTSVICFYHYPMYDHLLIEDKPTKLSQSSESQKIHRIFSPLLIEYMLSDTFMSQRGWIPDEHNNTLLHEQVVKDFTRFAKGSLAEYTNSFS